jgi:hypothetical protein
MPMACLDKFYICEGHSSAAKQKEQCSSVLCSEHAAVLSMLKSAGAWRSSTAVDIAGQQESAAGVLMFLLAHLLQ